MSPDDVLHEIDDLLALLAESELALSTTKVINDVRVGGFRRITWANNASVPGHLFREDVASVDLYREWVEVAGYSAILFDGSLVQLSFDFQHSELVGHRLVYFPCPFQMDLGLAELFPLIEVIDMYRDEPAAAVRLVSPVRFDYQRSGQQAGHPASHMTFLRSHVRIPVMSAISIGHFVQFVFENVYPEMWSAHAFLREWPRHVSERTIALEEQAVLHWDAVGGHDREVVGPL